MEPTRETDLLHRLETMEQALAALTSQNTALALQNGNLLAENHRLTVENKLLRAKVDKLVHRLFGKSNGVRALR